MLASYDRDYYLDNPMEDMYLNSKALTLTKLDWNYFIATYFDRDLHEKMLAISTKSVMSIISTLISILTLIRSGYFYSASLLVAQVDTTSNSELDELKTWLMKNLVEADDTQE